MPRSKSRSGLALKNYETKKNDKTNQGESIEAKPAQRARLGIHDKHEGR
jgi:hypothetical protein